MNVDKKTRVSETQQIDDVCDINTASDSVVPHYVKPVLTHYGDVRDVTLGPTGPPTESSQMGGTPRQET